MTDVAFSLCLQSWENCFLIAAWCELIVDLQMDMDFSRRNGKKERLDKSQVAKRTMSSDDLFQYVIRDNGNSALGVLLLKLLGGKPGEPGDENCVAIFKSSVYRD